MRQGGARPVPPLAEGDDVRGEVVRPREVVVEEVVDGAEEGGEEAGEQIYNSSSDFLISASSFSLMPHNWAAARSISASMATRRDLRVLRELGGLRGQGVRLLRKRRQPLVQCVGWLVFGDGDEV